MSANLLTRIIVSVIGVPVLLWTGYTGGWWLLGIWLLIALIANWELLTGEGELPGSPASFILNGALFLSFFPVMRPMVWGTALDSPMQKLDLLTYYVPPALIVLITLAVSTLRWSGEPPERFQKMARLFWAFCYVSFCIPMVIRLGTWGENFPQSGLAGGNLLLFFFVIIWVGDSSAMLLGNRFGRRPLAPSISPKKTVEGSIGGLLCATAAGMMIAAWRLPALGLFRSFWLALLVALAGQVGDLVESIWKRSVGAKESSQLIPGHGGVLDRFDSLLFAAPVLYFALVLLFS